MNATRQAEGSIPAPREREEDIEAPSSPRPPAPAALPTRQVMEALLVRKHGAAETHNWAVQRHIRYGAFLPTEVYEAVVAASVFPGCRWLDVGGGRAPFLFNDELARELVARCSHVTAIDPSEHVLENQFVRERVRDHIENYQCAEPFDLATMRMVVEHVRQPEAFVAGLARLIRPGGAAVVLTVNRWSPIALAAKALPFRWHHPIKRLLWGVRPGDSFPVHYRMNTRRGLARWFEGAGFVERLFARLDDVSLFCRFKRLNFLELQEWRAFHRLGVTYPEHCLLGIYERAAERGGDAPHIAAPASGKGPSD
jgi:SAM-dependent methyltransferase